jgi:RNA polymerase sigma-54 factor
LGGERDAKLDALGNTAARVMGLHDHLLEQWRLLDAPRDLPKGVTPAEFFSAGELIISNLQPDGYLRSDLESLRNGSANPPTVEALKVALVQVHRLDPAGVGARDLVECFLLQLAELERDPELAEGHDFPLERSLLLHHLEDLKLNRYPQLSKRLGRSIEELQAAVKRLSHLTPYPGHAFGSHEAPLITPDAVITRDADTGKYEIQMTHDPASNLSISQLYRKMVKDKGADRRTREFLAENVRNAKWLLDAIEQRKSTLLRVIRQVVEAQQDFLEKGPEFLRPLPMIDVADRLGIHVATVSRAVSEKYIQTPQGIFPLRRFFSGGTTSAEGEDMAWDAVKEKLKILIAEEDKSKPLGDEEIVAKLAEQGITLARRTVAKYRGLLNIPTARQRKQF